MTDRFIAHNPEVAGSSPVSATIRLALESYDSEAAFLFFRGFLPFGFSRFYSVLDRIHPFSLGDKWASNAKFAGRHRSSRRRNDEWI